MELNDECNIHVTHTVTHTPSAHTFSKTVDNKSLKYVTLNKCGFVSKLKLPDFSEFMNTDDFI